MKTLEDMINEGNALEVNVELLALNPRFGDLVFKNANTKLEKARIALKEVHDLKYNESLNQDDINAVNTYTKQYVQHLKWLNDFNIRTSSNAPQEHDDFERQIDDFYNRVYSLIIKDILPYLREERRRENSNQKQLESEVKRAVQIRTELEQELNKVREETEKIRKADEEVNSAKGERAAVNLEQHFKSETQNYARKSGYWLLAVTIGYALIISVLYSIGKLSLDTLLYLLEQKNVDANILWSILLSKIVVLAALWYGLSFIIKNYNVNSHLAAVNRHRTAAAKTLADFISIESRQEKPRLSEVLQNATEAIFKNVSIGYVSKTEKEQNNPILQIVNDVMGIRSNH